MTIQLPPIPIDKTPRDGDEFIFAVDAALYQLERHVLLAVRLFSSDSEDFHQIARQAFDQSRALLRSANQISKEYDLDRSEARRRAQRAMSTLSFLQDFGPYVSGSGGQRPAPFSGSVKSVTQGGLPGLGKH